MTREMPDIPVAQRALWTFLFHTLAGPGLAALAIFLATLVSGILGIGPKSVQGLPNDQLFARAANWAVRSYMWSAIPAALTGGALAGLVLWRQSFRMLESAVAGVGAFFVAMQFLAQPEPGLFLPLALLAALVALACRAVLVRAKVLR
jgi:hypothetical protein